MLLAAITSLVLLQTPVPPPAQAPAAAQTRLRVFLDCDCFSDYIRNEVTFVDYVRQRESADVHVLGRSQETGGSGREYTLNFVGAGKLSGFNLDLRAITTASDTEDTRRRAVESVLKSGFLVYMAKAEIPGALSIDVEADESRQSAPGDDPWNFWVYNLSASADFQAEESQRELSWSVSANADRVTEAWKMAFGLDLEQSIEKFDLDEDEPLESRRHSREADALIVKGFGQHWSAGLLAEVTSSSFENRKLRAGIAPAIEYNVFPYSEYSRRQLRAMYYVGAVHMRYYELTLFDKLRETRALHALNVTLDQREPWGTLQAQFEIEQYLPKTDQYRLEFNGDVSIRILRGLSLNLEGGASRIRDQISLPKRGATQEEVLLRLRRLQSGYEYNFDVGIRYTFGSIFNNIVNPRFGS